MRLYRVHTRRFVWLYSKILLNYHCYEIVVDLQSLTKLVGTHASEDQRNYKRLEINDGRVLLSPPLNNVVMHQLAFCSVVMLFCLVATLIGGMGASTAIELRLFQQICQIVDTPSTYTARFKIQ